MSRPRQACGFSASGSNVLITNKSFLGCSGIAITVHDANNVTISDIDVDDVVGGLYLVDVTGNVSISGIRARNVGDNSTGSGHSNVIQLSRTYDNDANPDIYNVKAYGGQTEDAISIYQSGGTSATNTLLIEDVHIEHPLSGTLAWQSDSGTCIDLADAGGHDIVLRNSTFLNCGAVGIQMNMPYNNVRAVSNILYGAQRPLNNVGLSQYGTCSCSNDQYVNNRVWWKNASGSSNPIYIQHTSYFSAITGNVLQDTTIDPNNLRVVL